MTKHSAPKNTPHEITHNGQVLAIIIPHSYSQPGVNFFTPNTFSQQLAYMNHPEGHSISAHSHNPTQREVTRTQEVLIIRKGRLRVDFYDNSQSYIKSTVLEPGDVILLASGGHGFEVLEEVEMIEVKQGPFAGVDDKCRFTGVSSDQIQIIRWPTN